MGREKPGEPQGAGPWAAGAWAAEAGEMLAAGSSHRLRGADRIQGLEQLREQGSSKRQMVLDGSQGRVSGVGNRSQSSPGQGRGNQAEAGGGGGFLPSPFLEREEGLEGQILTPAPRNGS